MTSGRETDDPRDAVFETILSLVVGTQNMFFKSSAQSIGDCISSHRKSCNFEHPSPSIEKVTADRRLGGGEPRVPPPPAARVPGLEL